MSRRHTRAAWCGALLLALAACAGHGGGGIPASETAAPAAPKFLIVRSFAAPERAAVLDPSFGFSLRRGSPGVPHAERAAAVGRAAAFALGEALTRTLRTAGLDAASTLDSTSAPPAGAVVVSGAFDRIDQGRRRRVGRVGEGAGESRVVAEARVTAPDGRVLLAIRADSERIPGEGATTEVRGVRVRIADANRDAGRVGRAIGRRIVDFARRSGWLPRQ